MASDKDDKKSSGMKKTLMWTGIGVLVLLALIVLYFRFIRSKGTALPNAAPANAAPQAA